MSDKSKHVEKNVAQALRGSMTHHDAVIEALSIYCIGGDLEVIYPLAETDLENFMKNEIYNRLWDTDFSLADVLIQMRGIASALKYLHNGMEHSLRRDASVCHMDFKPDNILVYLNANSTEGAFTFKISDFGVAKIQPNIGHRMFLKDAGVLGVTPAEQRFEATRPADTYSAPEMYHKEKRDKVGLNSDVWSLACILIEVITRQLLRREGMTKFDEERFAENDEKDEYFFNTNPSGGFGLNTAVENWLSDFGDSESDLVSAFKVKFTAKSRSERRLKAPKVVSQELCTILRKALKYERSSRYSSTQLYAEMKARLSFHGRHERLSSYSSRNDGWPMVVSANGC